MRCSSLVRPGTSPARTAPRDLTRCSCAVPTRMFGGSYAEICATESVYTALDTSARSGPNSARPHLFGPEGRDVAAGGHPVGVDHRCGTARGEHHDVGALDRLACIRHRMCGEPSSDRARATKTRRFSGLRECTRTLVKSRTAPIAHNCAHAWGPVPMRARLLEFRASQYVCGDTADRSDTSLPEFVADRPFSALGAVAEPLSF